MDKTGSKSCPLAAHGSSGAEISHSATREAGKENDWS